MDRNTLQIRHINDEKLKCFLNFQIIFYIANGELVEFIIRWAENEI